MVEYPEFHVVLPSSVSEYPLQRGEGHSRVAHEEKAVNDFNTSSLQRESVCSSLGRLAESYMSDSDEGERTSSETCMA